MQSLPLSFCHFCSVPHQLVYNQRELWHSAVWCQNNYNMHVCCQFCQIKFFAFLCFHLQHHYELPNHTARSQTQFNSQPTASFPKFCHFILHLTSLKPFFFFAYLLLFANFHKKKLSFCVSSSNITIQPQARSQTQLSSEKKEK